MFAKLPVTSNSAFVQPGSTFVAIKGMKDDGIRYIPQALQAGATTIVIQQDAQLDAATMQLVHEHQAQLLRVADTRLALAHLSAQAHGYPAQQVKMIGITGTKGKSTTTFLIEHMLRTAGYRTAMLSTVYNKILDTVYPTELTTQHPDYLHAFLRLCVERGVTHVVLEVAAQAVSLHRVAGMQFDEILFLNFSQEHGEFYATQADYFAAKVALLQQLKSDGMAIVSAAEQEIVTAARAVVAHEQLAYFSAAQEAQHSLDGVTFWHDALLFQCPALVGSYNIQNIRAALTCLERYAVTAQQMQQALATFTPVPGRFNKYPLPNGAVAFIDYASNPASFENVFRLVRPSTQKLIVVFGAGGDRDVTKRPLMGAWAAQYADVVILTTDNPRSEDVAAITAAIQQGIPADTKAQVIVELDREKAIRRAYDASGAGSVILLLGKGPDEYQLIKGIKYPFSERQILQSLGAEHGQRLPQAAGPVCFTKKLDTVE